MTHQLIVFPAGASAVLETDAGLTVQGQPTTHPNGDAAVGLIVPDSTPQANGAWVTVTPPGQLPVRQHGILFLNDGHLPYPWTPGQTAAFCADVFLSTADPHARRKISALHIEGPHFKTADGRRWIYKFVDGYCDYQRLRDEGADALRPVLQEAADMGANGRRVFLAGSRSLNQHWDIAPMPTPEFMDRVRALLALYAEYDLYAELTHGDLQVVCSTEGAQFAYYSALYDTVRDIPNALVEGANEWEKNGLIRSALDRVNRARVLSSVGSSLSGQRCPLPPYDFSTPHLPRSLPGIYTDAPPTLMQTGYRSDQGDYDGVGNQPCPINEFTKAGDVPDGWRRSVDPEVAWRVGNETRGWNGCCVGSDLGITSQLLRSSSTQYNWVKAGLDALNGVER